MQHCNFECRCPALQEYYLQRGIAKRWNQASKAQRRKIVRVLKLKTAEVNRLNTGKVALPASHTWAKDLTEDGDVEPNPGPQGSITCISVNLQGRVNAYMLFDSSNEAGRDLPTGTQYGSA